MSTAKAIRLGRILQKVSGRSLIVPIDHGLTMGPLAGIESTHKVAEWINDPHIDALIAHKGMITRLAERRLLQDRGVIMHLNGMCDLAPDADRKETLAGIASAVHLGVDGVSMQMTFTGANDRESWVQLGRVSDEAMTNGFPLLVMLYDKVVSHDRKTRIARMRQLIKGVIELGADAVKIAIPETTGELEDIFDLLHEDILILVAGGSLTKAESLLERVEHALNCGASGVCIGRNVFANRNSSDFLENLANVVHSGFASTISRGQLLHAY
jgi:class I fructose-bisphosphate aldolase/fructose-bisphosphate aldolase/2-amino-3,7-dideoxy-D-threo-hept-6-ulosonate synthase